jgi:2-amino-4-hydroxy-6-hydroxymethyldihydropteridine diphosphokinase
VSVTAYIALGSNLGDRRGYLEAGLRELRRRPGLVVRQVSAFYQTRPVGGPAGQGSYLNAAAELAFEGTAAELLGVLLEVERGQGRVRQERDGPRTLDLDLLLFGEQIVQLPDLEVPHPRLHQRLFVLQPLAEIAPGARHPLLQRTVAELLADLLGIRPVTPHPGRELLGLRALVTGSTGGIGRAVALELARGGANVLIHGRRAEAGEEVAAQVRCRGGRSGVLLADLAQPGELVRLVEQAWETWQGLDIWINNAGADTLTGEAGHWPFARKLSELLAVDVTASLLLSRDVGQRLKAQGGGVIVNMGWDQAETGMEGDSGELFATSKGAVMAFSRSLALSLAPEVRVHCLAPGWIRTAWGTGASEVWQQRVVRETPLGRWGLPEDVAAAARWLVSPAAAYLTGQVVRVNGGAVR